MLSLQLLIVIIGLISAGLGLATAYLNFRAAQKMVKTHELSKSVDGHGVSNVFADGKTGTLLIRTHRRRDRTSGTSVRFPVFTEKLKNVFTT